MKKEDFENIFNDLENKLYITSIDNKKYVIRKIIELNLEKDKINIWIENVKKLFNQLEEEINITRMFNKEDVIKKIIGLNLDLDKINSWKYEIKERIKEERVNDIFNELEDEYYITGFIEEDKVKQKIIELNCDKEEINRWVAEIM